MRWGRGEREREEELRILCIVELVIQKACKR